MWGERHRYPNDSRLCPRLPLPQERDLEDALIGCTLCLGCWVTLGRLMVLFRVVRDGLIVRLANPEGP